MPGTIFDFVDFRGGYATDTPSDLMQADQMLQADDVTWHDGLKKRSGFSAYSSVTGSITRGTIRLNMDGVWRTVRAVQGTTSGAPASNTTFEIATQTDFSTLTHPSGTAFAVTNGHNVQFAQLGEKVVAVNGVDPPVVVFSTVSSPFAETVERYSTFDGSTQRGDHHLYSGQYSSVTAEGLPDGAYADTTAKAQSSASATFTLQQGNYVPGTPEEGATTTGSTFTGFWVSSEQTFNFVGVLDMAATSSASFTLEYFGKASSPSPVTWVTHSSVETATWVAVGDRDLEFNYPVDPKTGEDLLALGENLPEPLLGKFCWRAVNRESSVSALMCQGLKVDHTQHLTQLFAPTGQQPSTVVEHDSKIFFGAKNLLRWGGDLYTQFEAGALAWNEFLFSHLELFEGGRAIRGLLSGVGNSNSVTVLMDGGIHTVRNVSASTMSVDRDQARVGPIGTRGSVVYGGVLYFVARDGIYQWDGVEAKKISKHIQSDMDSWTLSDSCAVAYKGKVYFAFPSNSRILEFDPDTYRTDGVGDGSVSFFRHSGVAISQFQFNFGLDDDGSLLGLDNTTDHGNGKIYYLKLYDGTVDKITATAAIEFVMQSKYNSFGSYHTEKVFRQPVFRVSDVSHTGGDDYTVKMFTENQYGEASSTATLTASVASGIHAASVTVPPDMDGYNFGFGVQHNTKYDAKFFGVSIEVEEKVN